MAEKDKFENMQKIDLRTLSLPQLNQFKNDMDQELGVFQDSLNILSMAQKKYKNSENVLQKVTPEIAGVEIFVPLTMSLYVPGRLLDTEHVMIDVGTDYYAKKSINDGKDFFKRRVVFLNEQIAKIQDIAAEKVKVREAVTEVLQMKLQQLNPNPT